MFFVSAGNFEKKNSKKLGNITVSNNLDPDQARQNVGPDLGPDCLQRISLKLLLAEKS